MPVFSRRLCLCVCFARVCVCLSVCLSVEPPTFQIREGDKVEIMGKESPFFIVLWVTGEGLLGRPELSIMYIVCRWR